MGSKLTDYIKSLRSKPKQDYAVKYAAWLAAGEVGDSPEYAPLSYLAAQAVRMRLQEIV